MTKKDNVDFKISAQCRICKKAKKKKKCRANLNKPIYIGIKILDLSKVSM